MKNKIAELIKERMLKACPDHVELIDEECMQAYAEHDWVAGKRHFVYCNFGCVDIWIDKDERSMAELHKENAEWNDILFDDFCFNEDGFYIVA